MDIQYVYTKKRIDFGRQCNFSDRNAELHVDITPKQEDSDNFILKNPIDQGIQNVKEMSEHSVNTERIEWESRGINHTEGGWPKDVNPLEHEQVTRYRKKVEKDEKYIETIKKLAQDVEHCIEQNNGIDIYNRFFQDVESDFFNEPPSAKTINIFRDPEKQKRSVVHTSWYPDGPHKAAMAYCTLDFEKKNKSQSTDSYVWDIENPNKPELTLKPSSSLVCIEFNPKDSHVLIGGQYNGQLAFWDTRKGGIPVEVSPVEESHFDPVYKVLWVNSKSGSEFFSTSTDGQVLWWDTRKLSSPTDKLYVDPTRKQEPQNAEGAFALEYEPTLPTKFLVGSEVGNILSCNRKAKTQMDKIISIYTGHMGPIYSLQRSPFFPKNFLSIGDWTARIWSEDLKESPIIWTKAHTCYLCDGAWSPTRPAVFFTTKVDGTMDVWDLSFKQKEATLSLQVCNEPLCSMKVHDKGRLIMTGSEDGVATLLELSTSLSAVQGNEKATMTAILEREAKRERILESRNREIKLKERIKSAKSGEEQTENDEQQEDDRDLIEQAEQEFYAALKNKKGKQDYLMPEKMDSGKASPECK